MAEKDQQKTPVVPKPAEDVKKNQKNGAYTIPIQMM